MCPVGKSLLLDRTMPPSRRATLELRSGGRLAAAASKQRVGRLQRPLSNVSGGKRVRQFAQRLRLTVRPRGGCALIASLGAQGRIDGGKPPFGQWEGARLRLLPGRPQ